MPYTVGKPKRRAFQQTKDNQIGHLIREIQPRKILGLKVGNSRECPGSVPERPPRPKGGGLAKGCRSICMEGGVSHSGSAVMNPLPGVGGRAANSNYEP